MANQATAKKGEEFRFGDERKGTTKDKIIFERIEQQQKKVLEEKQRPDLISETEKKILTGENSNVIDFLEYKAKKAKEKTFREVSVNNLRERDLPTEEVKNDWLKEKEKLVKEVAAASGIEDQEEIVKQTFYDKSPGEVDRAFSRVGILIGLTKMSPKQSEAILSENERINSRFEGKIPYNELPEKIPAQALAFDDVAAVLKDEKAQKLLSHAQSRGVFGKTKENFYRFVTRQRVGAARAQSIDKSVDYSMKELLLTGNSLGDAMERIYTGMEGRGLTTSLPNGVSNGLANFSAPVGSFLKKSLVNFGEKFGPGIRSGIGNVATNIGVGLGKAATGLGSALSSIGGVKVKAAATISVGVLIAIIVLTILLINQFYTMPNLMMGSGWEWSDNAVESNTN
jgi:hypothetical protein